MQAVSLHPEKLSPLEISVWRAILAEEAHLDSPYLTPDWAQSVGRARSDARVVVYYNGSTPFAFLPVQRRNRRSALPLGGPICDYQAVVCRSSDQVDLKLALKALNVDRIDFSGALAEGRFLGHKIRTATPGHIVDISNGWEAYAAERRDAGSQILKRTAKKYRKLQKDHSDVVFEAFTHDNAAFEQLLEWKRDQWRRTNCPDVFAHDWVKQVVNETNEAVSDNFGGELFTLKVDGELAAVIFCLRANTTLHAWFVSYNPKFDNYSPGQICFVETLKAMAEKGFEKLDLGPGDYRFKASLANTQRISGCGYVGGVNLSSMARGMWFNVRKTIENMPVGRVREWPGKAMRRWDLMKGIGEAADA